MSYVGANPSSQSVQVPVRELQFVHLGPQSMFAVAAKSDLTQRPKVDVPDSFTTTKFVSLHLVQFMVPPKSQMQKLGQKVLLRTHR